MSINEFNSDYLTPLLEKLSLENKNIVLLGDFNIDLLHYGDSKDTSEYLELMTSSSFFPFITLPTRITSKTKTLIDNIFLNFHSPEISSGNLTTSISDHMTQFLTIPKKTKERHKTFSKVTKRCYKHFNSDLFKQDIENIDWSSHIKDDDDVNNSIAFFLKTFEKILDVHAPYKLLTRNELKLKTKPWITKGILKSISIKNNLYKRYIKSKNSENKDLLFTKFKSYRNNISNLLRSSKKSYYNIFFQSNINSIKNTWKGIKDLINIKGAKNTQSFTLNINDSIITDKHKIANTFNDYFSTIPGKLSEKIITTNSSHMDYLRNPNQHSFFVQPVTDDEVKIFLNYTLKNGKSLGPNSIPTSVLKLVSSTISQPLTTIINNSFKSGTFPDMFKIAKVIPIHKKGSKLDFTNYRPISLLSNISKLFEKLMHNRLYKFLERFQCLYKHQFRFRNTHSTTHSLIENTETIRNALDNKLFACGVFIDLQKAFDTVNHNILLDKLSYYGIRGITLQWFKSYLSNRNQFVSINGSDSESKSISIGVPQGSILGPLLFLIYINDLNKCLTFSTAYHFADDTNLLITNKSLKKINQYINHDLACLVQWLRSNKISLNAKKTELVVFKSRQTVVKKHLNFRISGQKITPVKCIKYLGVKIDENLNFQSHLNDLSMKLTRSNGMLSKLRHYVNFETLLNVYHSIFGSHLRYACQVWGQSHNASFNRIISLQNKAMRTIHFQSKHFNSNILYLMSGVLKIEDLVYFLNCLFVWDQQHKKYHYH